MKLPFTPEECSFTDLNAAQIGWRHVTIWVESLQFSCESNYR